ncbi:hypothetical protein [Burkholderia glumae]|uniref:hypothetical protein n=1 Tax=Burkholderia glumae TaxID=337 RepID=UPI002164EAC6|nr:hypothetical protein [Burkholderia glumae]
MFVHAAHHTGAARPVGLRKWATTVARVVYRQHQLAPPSTRMTIPARRVSLHGVDIDAVEQPVKRKRSLKDAIARRG